MAMKFTVCANSAGQMRFLRWNETVDGRDAVVRAVRAHIAALAGSQAHSQVAAYDATTQIVLRRYNGVYFAVGIGADDDALYELSKIARLVRRLDARYANVCELDLVYSLPQLPALFDEM